MLNFFSSKKCILNIIIFNSVPIVGVFLWGWKVFDLIFIYWFENVVAGVFMVSRFFFSSYKHPKKLVYMFIAVFFSVHYGGFCFVHGIFILSIFLDSSVSSELSANPYNAILPILEARGLMLAALSMVLLQIFDWLRDSFSRGFGAYLMVAPYYRVIVLHVTLIVSGFALTALDEPVVGLAILIIIKTGFDLYNWQKKSSNLLRSTLAHE